MKQIDLLIVGGGPAGLAAAVSAYEQGIRDIQMCIRDRFHPVALEQLDDALVAVFRKLRINGQLGQYGQTVFCSRLIDMAFPEHVDFLAAVGAGKMCIRDSSIICSMNGAST